MSLTITGKSSKNYTPIPEGTHLAVCYLIADLGLQHNEIYDTDNRQVLIGWELPGQEIELEDGQYTRRIYKRYNSSLNERARLRQDLAAWRGKDFSPEELEIFNLRKILGTSCLVNIVHRAGQNGRIYSNVKSVMALPKGMEKGKASGPLVQFDFEEDPLSAVDDLPAWIANTIKRSKTYTDIKESAGSYSAK